MKNRMDRRLAYSLSEAASLLGVSVFTLRRDARAGVIRTIPYGRRVLLPAAELQRLAREGLQGSAR